MSKVFIYNWIVQGVIILVNTIQFTSNMSNFLYVIKNVILSFKYTLILIKMQFYYRTHTIANLLHHKI